MHLKLVFARCDISESMRNDIDARERNIYLDRRALIVHKPQLQFEEE